LIAVLIVILPKIGPMKMLAIEHPTTQTEDLYIRSVNLSVTALGLALRQLGAPELPSREATDRKIAEAVQRANESSTPAAADRGLLATPPLGSTLTLPANLVPNRDLDTGQRVVPGGYSLTDKTYYKLLARVTENPTRPIPEGLKTDILEYYADSNAPISTKQDKKKWAQVQMQLEVLTRMSTKPDSPQL